jgi:hypothetical protein
LDQFWRELNVAHLDLLRAFDGRLGAQLVVGRLDVHPNGLAHKLAAAEIGRFLESQIGNHSVSETVPKQGH